MSGRPRILVLVGYYLPGYRAGGPLRTIANAVERLGDEFAFRVITSDRDLGATEPYRGVVPNQWVKVGKAEVLYVPNGSPRGVLHHIRKTDHDILYLNSFFSPPFSMVPMWACLLGLLDPAAIVMAPRGEFSSGALELKPWKKRPYVALARRMPVYRRIVWHASSEFEAEDIRRVFQESVSFERTPVPPARGRKACSCNVATASDFPSPGGAGDGRRLQTAKPSNSLRCVFLSRIARKKNLDGAIRVLRAVRANVAFDVYGPIEDQVYWRECQRLIAGLPSNIRVRYRGEVRHEDVASVLGEYDLFLFPTRGENFGHVIYEALAAGCALLISNLTPWRQLEKLGVGWDVPLDRAERFSELIEQCAMMSPEGFLSLRARAQAAARKHYDDPLLVAQNRAIFAQALGR